MTVSTRQADHWQAHMHARLDRIQAAVLDLIDVGSEPVAVIPRRPSEVERLSQDRKDGHFHPTPKGISRRPVYESNPVLSETLVWESEVERAVEAVELLAVDVGDVLTSLGIPAPRPGSLTDATGLARMRQDTISTVNWMHDAVRNLADRVRDSDAPEGLRDRADYIERLSHDCGRRVGVREPKLCKAGCGREVPGNGTCGACRVRRHRQAS